MLLYLDLTLPIDKSGGLTASFGNRLQ